MHAPNAEYYIGSRMGSTHTDSGSSGQHSQSAALNTVQSEAYFHELANLGFYQQSSNGPLISLLQFTHGYILFQFFIIMHFENCNPHKVQHLEPTFNRTSSYEHCKLLVKRHLMICSCKLLPMIFYQIAQKTTCVNFLLRGTQLGMTTWHTMQEQLEAVHLSNLVQSLSTKIYTQSLLLLLQMHTFLFVKKIISQPKKF